MKKLVLLVLFIGLLATGSVFAQGTSYGLKGGLNLTSVYGDDAADDLKLGIGYTLGLAMKSEINENISIGTELLFSLKGFNRDFTVPNPPFGYVDVKATTTYSYIEVPVYGAFEIADKLEFLVGGYLAYLVAAQSKLEATGYNTETVETKDDLASFDYGVLVGCSYEVINNLTIEGRFTFGFARLDKDGNYDTSNYAAQILVGYLFI